MLPLLPFFLYAETHYRFPYFFSFLRKGEPGIIADVPHRVEPGHSLPVLILSKDAHLFPCVLKQVRVEIRHGDLPRQSIDLLMESVALDQKIYWRVFEIDCSHLEGWLEIDVALTIESRGRTITYHNDNHRTSSHRPLRVYCSKHPLPRLPGLHLGDPHTHSNYTEDQVEFGAPLTPSRDLSRAMGLSFFCVTDHSYDLDDRIDSYLENDPAFPKWTMQQQEVDSLNARAPDFVIVRGEEVTCSNTRGQNVHFLIFGQKQFIPGSGDGAEKGLHTGTEHSIPEVLQLKTKNAAAFAAHAQEPVPLLQRLLLGRGIWSAADLENEGLAGLQLINGKIDPGFRSSYSTWVRLLLNGKKLCAIAGNDAHGNFSRYRQIGIPFLTIREREYQLFGKWRTGVFFDGRLSEKEVVSALADGRSIITDGPVAQIAAAFAAIDSETHSERVESASLTFRIEAQSSAEFGELISVKVIAGRGGDAEERVAFHFDGDRGFSFQQSVSLDRSSLSYLRLEVETSASTSSDQNTHFCFTNPLWIDSLR